MRQFSQDSRAAVVALEVDYNLLLLCPLAVTLILGASMDPYTLVVLKFSSAGNIFFCGSHKF